MGWFVQSTRLWHVSILFTACTSVYRRLSGPSHCCYNTWHSQGKSQFHNHRDSQTTKDLMNRTVISNTTTGLPEKISEPANPQAVPLDFKTQLSLHSWRPSCPQNPYLSATQVQSSKFQYTCSIHLVNNQLTRLSFPKWKLSMKHVNLLEIRKR